MSKPSFVGFQEKIDIPVGFEQLLIEEEISTEHNQDQLFSLLSEPDLIAQWFVHIESLDSRPGGKVKIRNTQDQIIEAICTGFVPGKEISIISDEFGNFTGKVIKGRNQNTLKISFALLTDRVSEKRSEFVGYINRLRVLL